MIVLVRHGESEHHVNDLTGGWTDVALTQTGQEQIVALAERLVAEFASVRPQVIASDLLRARQSAEIIADKFAVQPVYHAFLREKNNGIAAGMSNQEAAKVKLAKTAADPDQRNYPQGETRREFYQRVVNGMTGLAITEQPLIIVSHKGSIQNILFWWLRLSIDDVCRLGISFNAKAASMSVLRVNKWGENEIALLNDVSHSLIA